MPSSTSMLRIAALVTALMAVHSAGAGEETSPQLQGAVAQNSTVAELRAAPGNPEEQRLPVISTEIGLVTGDGQQGFVSGTPKACGDSKAACAQ